MTRFEGKVALVTGGRSGIGAATAERLAADGAKVITVQRGVADKHDTIAADLADPNEPARVVDAVLERAGRIDILVNNAGVMSEATVVETPLSDWSRTLAVNLTAPFLLMKSAIPHMKQGGAIVNVGSIEGLGSNPRHPAYCASKAGLHGLTRAVATARVKPCRPAFDAQ
ncbi:MAG: SDR family oxidoreductase [Pseudomonadota bacterium]